MEWIWFYLLHPVNETIGRGDRFIIERLKEADGPVFLLLNKCDLVSKMKLLKINRMERTF